MGLYSIPNGYTAVLGNQPNRSYTKAEADAKFTGGGGGISGTGAAGRATFWTSATAVSSDSNYRWDNTNKQLGIGTVTGFTGTANTPLEIGGSVNSYFQAYIQNSSTGTSAASDFIAGADNDGVALVGHYSDMGILNSTWTAGANPTFNGFAANEGYYITSGGPVGYGTDGSAIKYFVGGFTTAAEQMRLTTTGLGFKTTAPTHTITVGSTGTGVALYNTTDQTTNYERVTQQWSGNQFNIAFNSGGSGTARAIALQAFNTGGANKTQFILNRSAFPFAQVTGDSTGSSSTSIGLFDVFGSSLGASSSLQFLQSWRTTIAQSGTAGYTALFANITETSTGSGAKNLMDLQVGSASKFKVDNTGLLTTAVAVPVTSGGSGQTTYTDGQLLIGNTTGNTLTKATLTAGTAIAITNGSGAITINGDGYTLQATMNSTNFLDATTYFWGPIATTVGTTAGISKLRIPKTGTIKACYVEFNNSGTLGTSETSTISIRLNNTTDTTVSSAVTNNAVATSFSNTGLSIAVTAGDYIEMKFVAATWATNPTAVKGSALIYIE